MQNTDVCFFKFNVNTADGEDSTAFSYCNVKNIVTHPTVSRLYGVERILHTLTDTGVMDICVVDCLWNRLEVDMSSPLRRTTNSPAGALFTVTRKSPPPISSTVPLATPEPDTSTRAASITFRLSGPCRPVSVSSSLTSKPDRSVGERERCLGRWKRRDE